MLAASHQRRLRLGRYSRGRPDRGHRRRRQRSALPGYAASLVDQIWETRDYPHRQRISAVAEALARAKAVATVGKPVVIADDADNPGGGGYTNSTGLLRGMLDAGLENAAMAAFYDPDAAAACHKAGLGATITLSSAARSIRRFGPPIEATARSRPVRRQFQDRGADDARRQGRHGADGGRQDRRRRSGDQLPPLPELRPAASSAPAASSRASAAFSRSSPCSISAPPTRRSPPK